MSRWSRLYRVLLMLSFAAVPATLVAQATAPSVDLGASNVGTSVTGTVTFTFSANTSVSSVAVLTQGIAGLDFARDTGSPGNCAAITYAANATCTVGVKFTPRRAGLRMGAVELYDSSATPVVTAVAHVKGLGNSPQAAVYPGTQSVIRASQSDGIAVDAAGNVYLSNNMTGVISKETFSAGSYTESQIATLAKAGHLAVDGTGSLFVAQFGPGVYKETLSGGAYTVSTLQPQNLDDGFGMAVDGLGNYFAVDLCTTTGSCTVPGHLYKGTLAAGAYTVAEIPAGSQLAEGVAVDAAGRAYLADVGNTSNLLLDTPSGSSYTQSTLFSASPGFIEPSLDASGSVYVSVGYNGLMVYRPSSGSYVASPTVPVFYYIQRTAVDSDGNVYFTNLDNSTNVTMAGKVDVADPQTFAFNVVVGGAAPAVQTATVVNIGNQPMSITGIALTGDNKFTFSGNTCTASTTLAPAASCTIGINFAPSGVGSATGTVTITDNHLGTAGSTQIIHLTATNNYNLAFTTAPPATLQAQQSAGTVVVAIQASGGAATTQTGAVTLTVTGPGYSQAYTVNAVNGSATFNLTAPLNTAGGYTYTATATNSNQAQATETVYPFKLAITTAPTTPRAAGAGTNAVTVSIQDNSGNATTQTTPITLTVTGPNSYSQTYGPTSGNGAVTFTTASLTALGTYTYTATSAGLTGATATQVIIAGAAASFTVSVATSPIEASVNDAVTVTAMDAFGNLATSYTGTVHLTSTDAKATLPADFTLTSGTATKNVAFGQAGTFTVTATDTANSAITGTSAAVTVTPLQTYIVTVNTDPANGTATNCTDQSLTNAMPDSSCSLRDAVAAVNALNITGTTSVQPVINFATSLNGGTIIVTAPLVLTANANLTGPGPESTVTISGGGTTRILQQNTAATATTVAGLTLTGGFATQGGAFYSAVFSNYTFRDDSFTSNGYNGSGALSGGALYLSSSSAVSVTGCNFANNQIVTTAGNSYGGAVYQSGGTLTIGSSAKAGTVFSSNLAHASTAVAGGALYVSNPLTNGLSISGVTFNGNTAETTGASSAEAGALYVSTSSSTIAYSITNSLFSNNTAAGQQVVYGGAAYLSYGAPKVTGSTFTKNKVTFYSTATTSAHSGGALYTINASLNLYNDTITANAVTGGIAARYGGFYGSGTAFNTVISGNSADSTYPNAYGLTAYASYIDTSTTSTCATYCTPMLSALGSYGGPTQTILPLPGSPLLGAGNMTSTYTGGATTDGRGIGFARTIAYNGTNRIDIGAVQANYSLAFVQQPANKTQAGSNFSPAPSVQIYESGNAFDPGSSTGISFAASAGTLTGTVADTGGLQVLTGSVSTPQNTLSLTATLKKRRIRHSHTCRRAVEHRAHRQQRQRRLLPLH